MKYLTTKTDFNGDEHDLWEHDGERRWVGPWERELLRSSPDVFAGLPYDTAVWEAGRPYAQAPIEKLSINR